MPFMEKQVTAKLTWLQLDGNQGTTFVQDADINAGPLTLLVGETTDDERVLADCLDYYDGAELYTVGKIEGYGARLSAPGYLDCTDWTVFATREEAEQYLADEYPDEEEEEADESAE